MKCLMLHQKTMTPGLYTPPFQIGIVCSLLENEFLLKCLMLHQKTMTSGMYTPPFQIGIVCSLLESEVLF